MRNEFICYTMFLKKNWVAVEKKKKLGSEKLGNQKKLGSRKKKKILPKKKKINNNQFKPSNIQHG